MISSLIYNATTPVNKITKAFDWGYYFDFLSAKYAYGVTKDDGSKYSMNTYENASGSKVFITFDNAAAMAQELYERGCEIPYSHIDIGDLVFYRAESLVDGDTDELEESSFRNITHVAIVYDKLSDGTPMLMECTNVYTKPIGRCAIYNKGTTTTLFSRLRACNLGFRSVMYARHPVAFGLGGNVPTKFNKYRGTESSNNPA